MNNKDKKALKTQAHHLNPVVIIGAHGLTKAVHQEIEVALQAHELIKLRLNCEDRSQKKVMIDEILEQHGAELIQQIGHTITTYRKKREED